jgi:hypothetical protein
MSTQALTLFTEHSQALQAASDMAAIVADNFSDGGSIAFKDLTRFKSGTGGSTLFTRISTDPSGKPVEDVARAIEAIVIERRSQRAYWSAAMGSGDKSPDCRSVDGKFGEGDYGQGKGRHDCAKCPWNQFGSKTMPDGKQGAGKACRETRVFFMIVKDVDGIFPSVLMLPPASLGNFQRYVAALTNQKKAFSRQVHRFELEKAKSQGGVDFAQVRISMVREMDPAEIAGVEQYANAMRPLLARFYEQAVEESMPDQEPDTATSGAKSAPADVPIGSEATTVAGEKKSAPTEIEPEYEIVAKGSEPADSAIERARAASAAKKGKKADQGEMFGESKHQDPA